MFQRKCVIRITPEEVESEFHRVGMETEVYLFVNGNESVIVEKSIIFDRMQNKQICYSVNKKSLVFYHY